MVGNYAFPGGKIRIDLTYTKYKVLREVAAENGWKVVSAKKRGDADNSDLPNRKGKDGNAS